MPLPCSTPQLLEISFSDFPTADTITLFLGETVDVDAIYTTDDAREACVHPLNWEAVKDGGGPVSYDTETSAAEDTTHTKTFDPSVTGGKGTYVLTNSLAWSDENPPVPPINTLNSDNSLTVIVKARKSEVDGTVEKREADAGLETREASPTVEGRSVDAGVEARSADAGVEARSVSGAIEARGVSANVEARQPVASVQGREVSAAVESRAPSVGVESRTAALSLPSRNTEAAVSGTV